MEWLNLHTSTLDSEAFMDASPPERSTWLLLLRYCVGQQNGGRIKGVIAWPDIKCHRVLGVSRDDLNGFSQLWEWDGQDLRVAFYPVPDGRHLPSKNNHQYDQN